MKDWILIIGGVLWLTWCIDKGVEHLTQGINELAARIDVIAEKQDEL